MPWGALLLPYSGSAQAGEPSVGACVLLRISPTRGLAAPGRAQLEGWTRAVGNCRSTSGGGVDDSTAELQVPIISVTTVEHHTFILKIPNWSLSTKRFKIHFYLPCKHESLLNLPCFPF